MLGLSSPATDQPYQHMCQTVISSNMMKPEQDGLGYVSAKVKHQTCKARSVAQCSEFGRQTLDCLSCMRRLAHKFFCIHILCIVQFQGHLLSTTAEEEDPDICIVPRTYEVSHTTLGAMQNIQQQRSHFAFQT